MENRKVIIHKYSPLWYSMMSMKAFSNGDHRLAEIYYNRGQEILKITDSIYLPLTCQKTEDEEMITPDASNHNEDS